MLLRSGSKGDAQLFQIGVMDVCNVEVDDFVRCGFIAAMGDSRRAFAARLSKRRERGKCLPAEVVFRRERAGRRIHSRQGVHVLFSYDFDQIRCHDFESGFVEFWRGASATVRLDADGDVWEETTQDDGVGKDADVGTETHEGDAGDGGRTCSEVWIGKELQDLRKDGRPIHIGECGLADFVKFQPDYSTVEFVVYSTI